MGDSLNGGARLRLGLGQLGDERFEFLGDVPFERNLLLLGARAVVKEPREMGRRRGELEPEPSDVTIRSNSADSD